MLSGNILTAKDNVRKFALSQESEKLDTRMYKKTATAKFLQNVIVTPVRVPTQEMNS